MAINGVITDFFFSHAGIDFSNHVVRIDGLPYGATPVPDAVMGDTTASVTGGVKTHQLTITFQQDESASQVGATLFAAVGTTVAWLTRGTSGGVGATNPNYGATSMLESITPIQGAHGEMQLLTAVYTNAGALSRATS